MTHFNPEIFTDEIKKVILDNAGQSADAFLLKYGHRKDLPVTDITNQILGRWKAKDKLPTWVKTEQIVFPPKLSMEQCSSEITAAYKAGIATNENVIIDLTGGFGVDSYHFSMCTKSVFYIEKDEALAEIAKWNFKKLKVTNIEVINADGIVWLGNTALRADSENTTLYVDPARRDIHNKKVFLLSDCEPDVVNHLPLFFEKSHTVLIKTSPMLDIDQSIKDLKHVSEVHVVAVNNECKEVLYLLKKNFEGNALIKAVNFVQEKWQSFVFQRGDEENSQVNYSKPLAYLYEPNVAILKAGAFKAVAKNYSISKIATNTHIYTSDKYISDFPGRYFKIHSVYKFKDNEIFRFLTEKKANITAKNFPYTVEEIKKIMKIKDGGNWFIFAVRDLENKPIIILCTKF